MKISLRGAATVVAATYLLVVSLDYTTYAATGQSMIIGQLNTGDNVTKVQRTTAGPAMEFQATTGSAPFAVSNVTKVVKLNADLVDGLNGADLQNRVYTYTTATTGGGSDVYFTLPQVPAGNYLMTYNANFKPQGSPTSPYTYSCASMNADLTDTTSQSTSSSPVHDDIVHPYDVGVGATSLETVPASGMPRVFCGAKDSGNSAAGWQFGSHKLRVTLVKVNGVTTGDLGTASAPAKGAGRASTP